MLDEQRSERERPALPREIVDSGVVAIARGLDVALAEAVAAALVNGGVTAFELTLNEPEADALRAVETVARRMSGGPLLVGAGTVLSIDAAKRALDAGARFLVMPHTDVELVAWAASRGVPTLPGAFTPTEALSAWRAGAAAVKLFPASVAGPAFIRELHGPFPQIPLIPTGGVTVDTIGGFIGAGAVAVGMGSWLTGDRSPTVIRGRASAAVKAVRDARAGRAAGTP